MCHNHENITSFIYKFFYHRNLLKLLYIVYKKPFFSFLLFLTLRDMGWFKKKVTILFIRNMASVLCIYPMLYFHFLMIIWQKYPESGFSVSVCACVCLCVCVCVHVMTEHCSNRVGNKVILYLYWYVALLPPDETKWKIHDSVRLKWSLRRLNREIKEM